MWIARTFWHLLYHHARMTLEADEAVRHASYRRAVGAAFRGTTYPTGEPRAAPWPLEHFLTERYLLYAQRRDGALRRGQVCSARSSRAGTSRCSRRRMFPSVRRPARAAASRATTAIAGAAAPLCFHVASVTFMLSG